MGKLFAWADVIEEQLSAVQKEMNLTHRLLRPPTPEEVKTLKRRLPVLRRRHQRLKQAFTDVLHHIREQYGKEA